MTCMSSFSQIITTTPSFPTDEAPVVITFDASKGTGGLKYYAGNIYAHTGVVTDKSNGGWTYVKAGWSVNTPACKLTSLGNNFYSLAINNIRSFYGVPVGEKILKMAFVFRNETGTLEGKGDGGTDIFSPVYPAGLQLLFTAPANDMLITAPQSLTLSAITSTAASINLSVNNSVVTSALNATSISSSYNFVYPGTYTVTVQASTANETVSATRLITYKSPVADKPIPAGMQKGINYSIDGRSATLVLHTPINNYNETKKVSDVYILGDFNDWTPSQNYMMYRSTPVSGNDDSWWLIVPNLVPGKEYAFQYLVSYKDGTSKRIADPYSQKILDPWNDKWINQNSQIYPNLLAYPDGKTTDIVSVLQPGKEAYNWQTTNYTTPNKNSLVIYELLLRDFTNEKSISATIAKLDYLKSLGINAIELMPVCEFDGNISWGYNPCFYFATDKAYGTDADYKLFIDECHKRGMAVIFDMVLNHATGNNPMAKLYWDGTANKTSTANPWFNVDAPHPYSVFSDFKHGYVGTQDYFKRVMKYWIDEFKVDGYRLDLSKGLTDTPSTESTAGNYDQARINNITRYFTAAKESKNDVIFILEHFCDANEESVLSDSGMLLWNNMNGSAKSLAKCMNSDLSYMNVRNQVAYMESHDEERVAYDAITNGLYRNDVSSTMKQLASEAALFMTVPGSKMIWQFGELGYDIPLGSGDAKMAIKPTKWEYLDVIERKQLFNTYSRVVNLRSKYPNAFLQPAQVSRLIGSSNWTLGKSVTITSNDLNVVVVSNLLNIPITTTVNFPKTGAWYDLMSGSQLNLSSTSYTVILPASSFIYYTDKKLDYSSVAIHNVIDDSNSFACYDADANQIKIKSDVEVNELKVYSLNGLLVNSVTHQSTVDASALSSGCYLVHALFVDGTQKTFKIMK